jgi:hypothetical protein
MPINPEIYMGSLLAVFIAINNFVRLQPGNKRESRETTCEPLIYGRWRNSLLFMPEKEVRRQDRGPWRGGEPGRLCICPNCGYEKKTTPEIPCFAQKCPRCGAPMGDL